MRRPIHPQVKAFLTMIAKAEGTADLGDNGYNVLFGGTLFQGYEDHPRVHVPFRKTYSTAAGRYQILSKYFDHYKKQLDLPDFSPDSQDQIAMQLLAECGAIKPIINGELEEAIRRASSRWASLPGAGYNQPERKISFLRDAFTQAGGIAT